MADSKIQWTNKTWNPTTGCTKVSAGCANCYAERMWKRLSKNPKHAAYGRKFTDVKIHEKRLDYPVHVRKPAMFFVDSMSDLFHEKVEDRFIADVFKRMAACPQHTFQILTKRPQRMMEFLKQVEFVGVWVKDKGKETFHVENHPMPLPNVWLGVSCEDQKTADERIPLLLRTPAAVHFISAEPLLGPINLRFPDDKNPNQDTWIICGGESGKKARPMHPDWARSLRDQCAAAQVPFFFKQWGEWVGSDVEEETVVDTYEVLSAENGLEYTAPLDSKFCHYEAKRIPMHRWEDDWRSLRVGKKKAGRILDGKEWNQFPERQ